MFTNSARFYDALYHFKDYSAAAEKLHSLIQTHRPGARSLLDVGCGTGKHLQHLASHYQVEGLDINAELLEAARRRCPGIPFHQASMVDFELDQRFDVITCLFSAIAYVKTISRAEQALVNMGRHLRPGGLLIVEPWLNPERYWQNRITANFVDEKELKIAWMYTSELKERMSVFDIHYLVGTPSGVEHFTERHEMGLFTHEEYLTAFRRAGCSVQHDPVGLFNRGLYWGLQLA